MIGLILLLTSFDSITYRHYVKVNIAPKSYIEIGHSEYFFVCAQEEFANKAGWEGPNLNGFAAPLYKERKRVFDAVLKLTPTEIYKMCWWGQHSTDCEIQNAFGRISSYFLCRLCRGHGYCPNCTDGKCQLCINKYHLPDGTLVKCNPSLCILCVGRGCRNLEWVVSRTWEIE